MTALRRQTDRLLLDAYWESKEQVPHPVGSASDNGNDSDFVIVNILSIFVFEPIASQSFGSPIYYLLSMYNMQNSKECNNSNTTSLALF